jgi:hypothetical protein
VFLHPFMDKVGVDFRHTLTMSAVLRGGVHARNRGGKLLVCDPESINEYDTCETW